MNKLSDLSLKSSYTTDDDVITFYNDTLSCAKEYDRISAYFNNGFYKFITKGLSAFLKENGQMRLVLSSHVDDETFDQIKIGYSLKENGDYFINDCVDKSVFELDKVKNNISLVSYLIAIDRLDVKFAFLEHGGILHEKLGIIRDSFGNILSFSGSNNETEAAIKHNRENFKVQYNWDEPGKRELESLEADINEFKDVWNNNIDDGIVISMNEIKKEELISLINFDDVKKFVLKPDFVRLSIDENEIIRIQTNIDIEKIKNHFLFRNIKSYITNEKQDVIYIENLNIISDIIEIKNILEKICQKLDVVLVVTKSYKKIIEHNYLDLDNISKIGLMIKDKDYLKNDLSYQNFCDKVNSIVKRPLKDAQLQAAYHILNVKRTMNFSVPGSGKTASVIGAFEYLNSLNIKNENYLKRILVIGPLNCFKSWKDEYSFVSNSYNKFDSTQIIDIKEVGEIGTRVTLLKYDFDKAKLILLNYESIVILSDILSKLVDDKTMVVFDEIHRIKNYNSEKLPACLKIVDNAKFRVALTGTPLPNGYQDLLCMFKILYGDYANEYFKMNVDSLKQADYDFENNGIESKSLNDKIFPFFIRVNKKELKVPKANDDHIIEIPTTEIENKLYNEVINSNDSAFEKIIRLTKISCLPEFSNSSLVDDSQNYVKFDHLYTSKIKKLLELVSKIDGKIIIWCDYILSIEKIYQLLLKENYKVEKIYGEIEQDNRNAIIDKFNNTDEIDIIIANPHTLAESVSLHKSCHTAIYVEINYNLAQFLQSRDRIHRLGLAENQDTDYYILMNRYNDEIEKSIDNVIYFRLKKKEQRMLNAIDNGSIIYRDIIKENEYDEIMNILKRHE